MGFLSRASKYIGSLLISLFLLTVTSYLFLNFESIASKEAREISQNFQNLGLQSEFSQLKKQLGKEVIENVKYIQCVGGAFMLLAVIGRPFLGFIGRMCAVIVGLMLLIHVFLFDSFTLSKIAESTPMNLIEIAMTISLIGVLLIFGSKGTQEKNNAKVSSKKRKRRASKE